MDTKKMTDALTNSNGKIAMFADGFVDEVWEIINARASDTDYTLYTRMNDWAQRIVGSGSGGVGVELIRKRRAFGGFAPNIGYAAARLGVSTTLFGVFGKGQLHPVFEEVGEICTVHSVDEPSVTHVFEFDDGKILMSHMESVQEVSWKSLVNHVDLDKMREILSAAEIIGIGYWSLLPAFDEILENICANLPNDGNTRRFFYDFADFRKKDESSLKRTLATLKNLNEKYPQMLSVNEHEGATLFTLYGETFDENNGTMQEKTERVRKQMGISELIIHAPTFAVAASSDEAPARAESIFCEKPIRTAGGGDTFNGAYMAAKLAGLDIENRLHVANAAVGYFLRNAAFPKVENLMFA
ncbi:MAG: carbohydrate kinase family protein [Defluviitaleaceae bacterium]|nr:carbohydrate kinase family protein [Defluviitaleaceae bacterium]MCL2274036.1 carbohydrate kinase family protein [Defluviitaleaceae bacterium]MCL2274063.1 carbohydrate kinase family protein [Defluviitaleaceae bacterium]